MPPEAMGNTTTKIMLAVLAENFPNTTTIHARTGFSASTIKIHLIELRRLGLVGFSDQGYGTIHATSYGRRPAKKGRT